MDPQDQLNFLRSPGYPAEFLRIGNVPRQGGIVCGDNPWLHARLVDGFQAGRDAEGKQIFTWKERKPPKPQG